MTANDYLVEMTFTPFGLLLSPQELEDMVAGLAPLWARAQWARAQARVIPLGTLESRLSAIRQRLNQLKPHAQEPVLASKNN
jgi:hypothetical protein